MKLKKGYKLIWGERSDDRGCGSGTTVKVELTRDGQTAGFACQACGVVYPVRDEIPIMLVEEAVPRAEWDKGERG